MSGHAPTGAPDAVDLRQAEYPPIAKVAIATLIALVSGGVVLAAQINHAKELVVPSLLLAVAAVLLVVNVALLARIKNFAWGTFTLVGKWALLAYMIIAGILEFVFIFDHTPGAQLGLFTGMLLVFALNVPLLLGYSVARYASLPGDPE